MKYSKKMLLIAAIVIPSAFAVWLGVRGSASSPKDEPRLTMAGSHESESHAETARGFQTKASNRQIDGESATHRPERLKDFMLPEVAIDGLELEAALQKVFAAYQDACNRSGETPLALRFIVPPGNYRKLHLRLNSRDFRASVQLLATLSGMKVSRNELDYHFARIENDSRPTNRTLQVPHDFRSVLQEMTDEQEAQLPLNELLTRLGLDLDSSTALTLDAEGKLTMETHSSADAAVISALARTLVPKPHQHRFSTTIIELPADSDWTPPDASRMDDAMLQVFLVETAGQQGVNVMTTPSVTTRNGRNATIEIINQMILPTDETESAFETHDIGQVMNIQGNALGFGQDVGFDYTHTTGDLDPVTSRPDIRKQTEVVDSGFAKKQGARIAVQTRPDGSRTVVWVSAEMIDATGQPMQ